jgi:hypothetical protein
MKTRDAGEATLSPGRARGLILQPLLVIYAWAVWPRDNSH